MLLISHKYLIQLNFLLRYVYQENVHILAHEAPPSFTREGKLHKLKKRKNYTHRRKDIN